MLWPHLLQVMATSCLPVHWRTLGHVARGLVAPDGVRRPGPCAGIYTTSSGNEAIDGAHYNTLPCGAPCGLYDEWGGGLMCGRQQRNADGSAKRLDTRCV